MIILVVYAQVRHSLLYYMYSCLYRVYKNYDKVLPLLLRILLFLTWKALLFINPEHMWTKIILSLKKAQLEIKGKAKNNIGI